MNYQKINQLQTVWWQTGQHFGAHDTAVIANLSISSLCDFSEVFFRLSRGITEENLMADTAP